MSLSRSSSCELSTLVSRPRASRRVGAGWLLAVLICVGAHAVVDGLDWGGRTMPAASQPGLAVVGDNAAMDDRAILLHPTRANAWATPIQMAQRNPVLAFTSVVIPPLTPPPPAA